MTLNKTLIKDKTLAGFILLLFFVDILIGVVWTSYDPLKSKEDRTFLDDVGIIATEIKC